MAEFLLEGILFVLKIIPKDDHAQRREFTSHSDDRSNSYQYYGFVTRDVQARVKIIHTYAICSILVIYKLTFMANGSLSIISNELSEESVMLRKMEYYYITAILKKSTPTGILIIILMRT